MDQADSVHSTPRRFTPKIVGGVDHTPMKSKIQPRAEQADQTTTTGENAQLRQGRPPLSPGPRDVYGEGDRHSDDDANECIQDCADDFSRPARSSLHAVECADGAEDRHHQDQISIIATFDAAVFGDSIGPGQFLRSALRALPGAERNGLPAVMAGDRLHCSNNRQLRFLW
jgi:hypothetical protein